MGGRSIVTSKINAKYNPPGSGGGGGSGTVTSVDLTAPPAFNVTGNPVTTNGTLALSGAGTFDQYIDGTGALRTLRIVDTLANIQALAGTNSLVPGAVYFITDVISGGWQVMLQAINVAELSTVGLGIYQYGALYAAIEYSPINGAWAPLYPRLLKVSEAKFNNTVEYNANLDWDNIAVFAWDNPNVKGNTIDGTSKFDPGTSSITVFNYNTIINNSEFTLTSSNLNNCNNNTIDNSTVLLTNVGLITPADFKQNKINNSVFSINTVDFININNNHIDYYNLSIDTLTVGTNFIDNTFIGYYDLNVPAIITATFVECVMDIINNKFINTPLLFNAGPIGYNTTLCTFQNNIFENNTKEFWVITPSILFIAPKIDYFKNNKFYNSLNILFDNTTEIETFNDNICENSFLYQGSTVYNLNNNSWKNCFDFEFIGGNVFNSFSHNTFLETSAWVESMNINHDFTYNNMQYVRDVVNPTLGFSLKVYEDQNYKYCIKGVGSTFIATLDFTDSTIYNGGSVINFNTYGWQNWVGVYTIINSSTNPTIDTFYKAPEDFPFYIWGQTGDNIVFNSGNNLVIDNVFYAGQWYLGSEYDFMQWNSFDNRNAVNNFYLVNAKNI